MNAVIFFVDSELHGRLVGSKDSNRRQRVNLGYSIGHSLTSFFSSNHHCHLLCTTSNNSIIHSCSNNTMEPTQVDEEEYVRMESSSFLSPGSPTGGTTSTNDRKHNKEPPRILAFQFQGYAIWLDLEQQQQQQHQHEPKPFFLNPSPPHTTTTLVEETKQDLDDALRTASAELGVAPIPAPHVTALYGIQHLSEDEVRQRFQDVANELFWFRQRWSSWPVLEPVGFLSNVEIAGKNGGQMVSTLQQCAGYTSLIPHNVVAGVFFVCTTTFFGCRQWRGWK